MTAAETMSPSSVRYVTGDATAPEGDGLKIIAHCCNNIGLWGAGFVLSLSKKWDRPEAEYRGWHERTGGDLPLGAMQLVPVEPDVYIANLVGQHGVRAAKGGEMPIRYEAISKGFRLITQYALAHREKKVSVHMPRLGCALAGGSWAKVEPLIDVHFVANGILVTVYDWPGGTFNP